MRSCEASPVQTVQGRGVGLTICVLFDAEHSVVVLGCCCADCGRSSLCGDGGSISSGAHRGRASCRTGRSLEIKAGRTLPTWQSRPLNAALRQCPLRVALLVSPKALLGVRATQAAPACLRARLAGAIEGQADRLMAQSVKYLTENTARTRSTALHDRGVQAPRYGMWLRERCCPNKVSSS